MLRKDANALAVLECLLVAGGTVCCVAHDGVCLHAGQWQCPSGTDHLVVQVDLLHLPYHICMRSTSDITIVNINTIMWLKCLTTYTSFFTK